MPKKSSKYPKLAVENCGRWFDDYVLTESPEKFYIEAQAKNLPRDLLKKVKPCPAHASAILEIYSETHPEDAKKIRASGQITPKQYKEILKVI